MDSKEVNYDFAKSWDLNQGEFAQGIAHKIMAYNETNNKNFKSVYDICCGASNLLSVLSINGFKCFGTETREGMYEYSKDKLPEVTYFLTKNIYDLPGKEKVDLITCTHDIVNYLEDFKDWELLFKNVAKHLNKKGAFLFDFYTKQKLSNWNETTYTSGKYLDCLFNARSGIYDKTLLTYTYYINYDNFFIKTKDMIVECYFDVNRIVEALKKAGLKNVEFVDSNLNPIDLNEYQDRIYIIASRK